MNADRIAGDPQSGLSGSDRIRGFARWAQAVPADGLSASRIAWERRRHAVRLMARPGAEPASRTARHPEPQAGSRADQPDWASRQVVWSAWRATLGLVQATHTASTSSTLARLRPPRPDLAKPRVIMAARAVLKGASDPVRADV